VPSNFSISPMPTVRRGMLMPERGVFGGESGPKLAGLKQSSTS